MQSAVGFAGAGRAQYLNFIEFAFTTQLEVKLPHILNNLLLTSSQPRLLARYNFTAHIIHKQHLTISVLSALRRAAATSARHSLLAHLRRRKHGP